MKKTVYVLIALLIIVYLLLSLLGRDNEYAAERALYRAAKAYQKIAVNPDVVPPAMFTAVEGQLKLILEKYPKTNAAKAAQFALAEFYNLNKKYDESINVLDTIINSAANNSILLSKAHFLKGNVYERQHKTGKASAEYAILRDKYKETPLGLKAPIFIGDCYARSEKYAEADKAYNEAANFYGKLEKDYRGKAVGYLASNFLLQIYAHLDKYNEAGKVIEDTIDNYPSEYTYSQYAPSVEAIFVKKLNNPAKAVEIYKRILEKSKDKRLKKVLGQRVGALEGKK